MFYNGDFAGDQTHMWLERGMIVGGTKYTITTGRFWIHRQTYQDDGSQLAEGQLFPPYYYLATGHDTYENVISAFCTYFGKTAVFRDPTAAWLDYNFLALGREHPTDRRYPHVQYVPAEKAHRVRRHRERGGPRLFRRHNERA